MRRSSYYVPGILNQWRGHSRFNLTMHPDLDIERIATCTTCRFKEDKSNYWTAVMYFKHPNGSYIRVREFIWLFSFLFILSI